MTSDQAQAMLSSTQQLRTHWSGVITNHLGLSLTINIAIWSYFLAAYVESLTSEPNPTYIFVASSLSSILLGLWRLNTKHIDDHLANLYPDFMFAEGNLNIPPNKGTGKYLSNAIPNIGSSLQELDIDQRVKFVELLVSRKKAGDRGHGYQELFAMVLIGVFSLISIVTLVSYSLTSQWLFLIGNLIGFILVWVAKESFQRNPTTPIVSTYLNEARNSASAG